MAWQEMTAVGLLCIIIICYAVTACAVYNVIGNEQDNTFNTNFGHMLGAGLFALLATILSIFAMQETVYTLAISVVIGVLAIALSVGALMVASIKH